MHRRILVAMALLTAGATPVWGQGIRGRIIDETTNDGVPSASIVLLNQRSIPTGIQVLSNMQGRFSMEKPAAGIFRLEIQRIGYATLVTLPFELLDDGEIVNLDVYLVPQVVEIDPITLEVRPRAQLNIALNPMEGFRYRSENGFGRYVTREDLDTRYPSTSMMAVLRAVQGINIGRVQGETIATASRASVQCGVKWWLDGRPIREIRLEESVQFDAGLVEDPDSVEADVTNGSGRYSFRVPYDVEDLDPEELAGLEVYQGIGSTPAEFSWPPTEPFCAAVVVWTKMWERREISNELAELRRQRRDTLPVRLNGGHPLGRHR